MIKIIFKLPKSKIVLFDAFNKEIVINSILKGYDYFVLETRGKVIVLNYRVLYDLIRQGGAIIKKKIFINILREIKKLYFISIIDIVGPKILITYIDNDPYFHEVCRLRKDIIGVGIQNGARSHYNYHDKLDPERHNKYYLPYYFVHGNHVEHVYKEYNHQFKEIFVVGSIKLDYFLSKQKIIEDKQFELCLISTWTCGDEVCGDYPFSTENQYQVLMYIRDTIIKYGYKLVIALKTNKVSEVNFYKGIFHDNATYKFDSDDPFSSYSICYKSKVILTTYSTLGFEFYSIGSNVVFFNFSGDDRFTHSASNTITSLKGNKLNTLINQMLFEDKKYRYKSLNDVQCVQNNKPSFEVIREFINKVI